MRRPQPLRLIHLRMPLHHFRQRRAFELVDQIVGFDALSFSPADLDERPLRLFFRQLVAHFLRAARR